MRVLITGSTGFIGGSLGRYAAQAGHTVTGTGRSKEASKDWPGLYTPSDATAESLREIVNNFAPDVLLHGAGSASVSSSIADPLSDLNASALACANVLEAVRRADRNPLVVIASSAAVYGNPPQLPVNEEAPVRPISPYGFHKAICETLAREYAECFGLDLLVCRFFSVFGASQRRLLIWELYQQLAGPNQTAWLDGSGSESRDFLYIDDAAEAVFGLIEGRAKSSGQRGSLAVVNVASGQETTVLEVAKQVRDTIAPKKEILCRGNAREGDPRRWHADISRLQSMLPSWRPRPVTEALGLCITAWRGETEVRAHGSQ
jgi:UDP-glucose 4-epimerase